MFLISFLLDILWQYLVICVIYRFVKAMEPMYRVLKAWYVWPALGWKLDYSLYTNQWVVITGCTDGIGLEYTKELAKKGFKKFFLIGRNVKKLEDVASMLRHSHNATVEYSVFDFSSDDYEKLPVHKLQTYDIGMLVNCCGIAVDRLTKFTEQPKGHAERIIRVNALSALKMIEIVLPRMVEADHGIIVNVSSIQGWRPLPLLCTYPASKACLSFLSECLRREYECTNVKIQTLIPLLVGTKLSRYNGQSDGRIVISPENYAKDAVDALGLFHIGSGCRMHDLQICLLQFLPIWMTTRLVKPFYQYQAWRFEQINKQTEMLKNGQANGIHVKQG